MTSSIADSIAPRAQSLLAYLILHAGGPQPRQRLAYILWPDSTEAQARTNLRKVIHQIRNSLPAADECLYMTRTAIQWNRNSPYWVDVLELDRMLDRLADDAGDVCSLQRVAELYAGELLPGNYDDWIGPQREDYRRQRPCRVRYAGAALGR